MHARRDTGSGKASAAQLQPLLVFGKRVHWKSRELLAKERLGITSMPCGKGAPHFQRLCLPGETGNAPSSKGGARKGLWVRLPRQVLVRGTSSCYDTYNKPP